MIEFDMRRPVCHWLLNRGLSPVLECASLGNCDIVGVRLEGKPMRLLEVVAVELKLTDVAGVMRQCDRHMQRGTTEVWAAMPIARANDVRIRFVDTGIGLLGVGSDVCAVLVEPVRREGLDFSRIRSAMMRRRDEWKWRINHPQMLRVEKI